MGKNTVGMWYGVSIDRFKVGANNAAVKAGHFTDGATVIYGKSAVDGKGRYALVGSMEPEALAKALAKPEAKASDGQITEWVSPNTTETTRKPVPSGGSDKIATVTQVNKVANIVIRRIDALKAEIDLLTKASAEFSAWIAKHDAGKIETPATETPEPDANGAQVIPACGPRMKQLQAQFPTGTKVKLPATAPCTGHTKRDGSNCTLSVSNGWNIGAASETPETVSEPEPITDEPEIADDSDIDLLG